MVFQRLGLTIIPQSNLAKTISSRVQKVAKHGKFLLSPIEVTNIDSGREKTALANVVSFILQAL